MPNPIPADVQAALDVVRAAGYVAIREKSHRQAQETPARRRGPPGCRGRRPVQDARETDERDRDRYRWGAAR